MEITRKRGNITMAETDELALKDVKRKNFVMFIAFTIGIIGALAVTIIKGDYIRVPIYAIGLLLLVSGYIIDHYFAKKHFWFPYYMVILGNIIMIISDRKSTRLNSSHVSITYAVFCLKKKT